MGEIILWEIPYLLRAKMDTDTGDYSLERYNASNGQWEAIDQRNIAVNLIKVFGIIAQQQVVHQAEKPKYTLYGSEAGGIPFSIQEDTGKIKIVNEVSGSDEFYIDAINDEARISRHLKPSVDGSIDIGDSSTPLRFRNLAISGNANVGGDVNAGGKVVHKGVDRKGSATASAVASGNTPTYADITPSSGYNAIFPISGKITPSGLATGESLTVYIKATYSDGTTAEITKSGVTAETYLTQADLHALIKDGVYIAKISVGAVSNLTTTSASVTLEVIGIQH